MTRLHAILPVLLAPLLLAGCFPNPSYRDLPSVSVIQTTTEVVDTVTVADNAKPTEAERKAVAAALAKAGEVGVRVQVRLPQGIPVPAADELRRRVEGLGVEPSVAVIEPGLSANGTTLVFVRISATAPDCAAMVTPSEEWSAWARPRMSFGCATYTNLTNMVVDPADLANGRNFGGGDATVTADAIKRYHDGQVKPLRQTSTSGSAPSAASSGSGQ
ncbi:MAG: CpaD family pilus assembly lipoprotein [Bacteroidales bacterium]